MNSSIINQLKEDNLTVFNTVYQQYHVLVYSFIYHKTQSDFIAQEVVQLAFIRLWQQRNLLKEDVEINVQLFGMARQVMIDELRKEATRSKHHDQSALNPFSDSLIKMIESRDILQKFEEEIESLPRVRKMVFNLSRKQGLTHKEIGEILSISPRTVEAHINKVLFRLRQYMASIFL